MEKAWEQECGGNFSLTSEKVDMPQGGVRLIPVFSLTKAECLYVATKFNDAARAFHYYSLEGEKKECAYLVWTPIGMEFIRTIV